MNERMNKRTSRVKAVEAGRQVHSSYGGNTPPKHTPCGSPPLSLHCEAWCRWCCLRPAREQGRGVINRIQQRKQKQEFWRLPEIPSAIRHSSNPLPSFLFQLVNYFTHVLEEQNTTQRPGNRAPRTTHPSSVRRFVNVIPCVYMFKGSVCTRIYICIQMYIPS